MALLLDQESKSYKKQHLLKLQVCWIDTYRIVKCEFFLQPVALYLLLNTWERFWRYVKFEKVWKKLGQVMDKYLFLYLDLHAIQLEKI